MSAAPVMRSGSEPAILAYLADEHQRLNVNVEGLYFTDLNGDVTSDQGKKFPIRDREYYPQVKQPCITRLSKQS